MIIFLFIYLWCNFFAVILPVKKEENQKSEVDQGNGEELERQVATPKNGGGSVTPPRQAYFTSASRDPIIVSLQDG